MDIDDKSKISLILVLSTVPFVVGAIIWLAAIDSRASAANEEVRGVRTLLLDVRERVIKIEVEITKTRRK